MTVEACMVTTWYFSLHKVQGVQGNCASNTTVLGRDTPNVEVLRRANMSSIEATLTASQLRWTGHIIRMNDSRLPKAVFYGELTKGKRLRGGQRLRYKDVVKRHPKATHITVDHWETLAQDRQQWRQAIHKGKSHIEERISQKIPT